jgi:hypothetical protein
MTESQNAKPNSGVKDVSGIFDHYRVSARAIWNTAFWPDADFRNWDSIERFDEIQELLFDELVLAKIGKEWPLKNIFRNAIPFFRIIPRSQAPIMIQNPRSETATGYWDHPVNTIEPGQAELQFIAYFDWNRMDYADLRYYRVKIAGFEAHPELVGREALIDREHTAVHLTDE